EVVGRQRERVRVALDGDAPRVAAVEREGLVQLDLPAFVRGVRAEQLVGPGRLAVERPARLRDVSLPLALRRELLLLVGAGARERRTAAARAVDEARVAAEPVLELGVVAHDLELPGRLLRLEREHPAVGAVDLDRLDRDVRVERQHERRAAVLRAHQAGGVARLERLLLAQLLVARADALQEARERRRQRRGGAAAREQVGDALERAGRVARLELARRLLERDLLVLVRDRAGFAGRGGR